MIVTRGYGKAKYPNQTIVGSVQNSIPAFGYGTVGSVSTILSLSQLTFVTRVTAQFDIVADIDENFIS